MNTNWLAILSGLTLSTNMASAVSVVVNIRNFTGPATGITLLDASGAAATNTTFFAATTFAEGTDFNRPVAEILQGLTIVSSVAAMGAPAAGLLNSQITYEGGTVNAPAGIVGSPLYLIFGNGNTILNSTHLAILRSDITFPVGDPTRSSNIQADVESAGKVVYGLVDTESPVVQPGNPAFIFPASVQLTNVPEPSALLLGGLGLLAMGHRHRRMPPSQSPVPGY